MGKYRYIYIYIDTHIYMLKAPKRRCTKVHMMYIIGV